MPGYESAIKVYYCKQTESPADEHRLAPAPIINISPEIYYANDSVVGYTYNISLTGYANALRKDLNSNSTDYGADKTIEHMGDIREIFNFNGGNLYIKQGSDDIIVAKGATIKNITLNASENRWVNYSQYNIEIEFNEVDFIGCVANDQISCASTLFHTPNQSGNHIVSDHLIDMKQYKIKEFNDKWSFVIDEQIYNSHDDYYNNIFKVTYSLSATGKNYYVDDNLIPAWQQAKNFVQNRLHKQIMGLMGGILQIKANNNDGCAADIVPSGLYQVDNTSPRESGILDGFVTLRDGLPNYDIYNESIDCDTSEADGSFSITYNATLKRYNTALSPVENAAVHTFTLTDNYTRSQPQSASISVQGNIQGLVRGGFIYYNNDFVLPNNGTFITTVNSNETKYSNALAYFKKKVSSGSDLHDSMKTSLGITKAALLVKNNDGLPPKPSAFNVDHTYNDGIVSYNVTYDKALNEIKDRGYTNISIVRNDPIEIIQEFIVPGRISGPIIQKLNMKTSRTISINIEGRSKENKQCIELSELDVCNDSIPKFSIAQFDQMVSNDNINWIKTKEDYDSNPIDGSFTISLEYLCRG
jgi:hypothetical protein